MTTPPSPGQVRSVFRQFLRLGRSFPNYNIRHYIHRKAREDFHGLAKEADSVKAASAWEHAQHELEVFKRQALVYNLYGRKLGNVLEVDAAKAGKRNV